MGTASDKPMEPMRVQCEMCLTEVPISEAEVAEGSDYASYFCGRTCLEEWKHLGRPQYRVPSEVYG